MLQQLEAFIVALLFMICLEVPVEVVADGWHHTRGRGQVQLPSANQRYLKSHAHASISGLSETHHYRFA
jgi:hypothetical protein